MIDEVSLMDLEDDRPFSKASFSSREQRCEILLSWDAERDRPFLPPLFLIFCFFQAMLEALFNVEDKALDVWCPPPP